MSIGAKKALGLGVKVLANCADLAVQEVGRKEVPQGLDQPCRFEVMVPTIEPSTVAGGAGLVP